jgi:hypothetical protein
MAINGWYVKKIITDLQEGKVDEFIQKEGKWFNYIKGEDTTFTSSIDNADNNFSGNLDVTEFAVQGIGVLSVDATVASGTTPTQGGNVSVTFNNATLNAANWTTTGYQASNITVLPATATFTITPNAGYSLSADDFFSVSITLPSWITSITFADTGTAGTASNTVVGTINFDTSTVISSGSSLTDSISLGVTATPSLVTYEATVIIYGIFEANGNIEDSIGLQNAADYTLVSSSSSELVYTVSKTVTPGVINNILQMNFFYGPSVIPSSPNVSLTVQPGESSQYFQNIGSVSPSQSTVQVNYTPNLSQSLDAGNTIHVYSNSALGSLNFNTTFGDTSGNPYGLLDDGGTQQVSIVNTLGSATITASGDIASSILNLPLTVSQYDSSFDLILAQNTSGSNVTGSITITSNNNPSLSQAVSDTIFVEQGLANTVAVTSAIKGPDYEDPYSGITYQPWTYNVNPYPSNSIAGFFSRLDGGAGSPVISSSITTTIKVRAEVEENQSTNLSNSNFSINYTSGGSGWITPNGIVGGSSGLDFTEKAYDISPNTTTSEREAYITFPHPENPSVVDTINIKQQAGYSATNNTFDFSDVTLASPYKIADGVEFEIDYTPQSVTIYGASPSADISPDENPFQNSPLLASVNLPTYITPYYYFDFYGSSGTSYSFNPAPSTAVGLAPWGDNWFSNLNIIHDIPTVGSGASLVMALPIQYKITFDVDENQNVPGPGDNFPIDRTVTLSGYNTLNNTTTADDTITIRQKGRPTTRFNGGPGGFINDSSTPNNTQSATDPDKLVNNQVNVPATYTGGGLDIALKSNSSVAPTVQNYATRVAAFNTIGVAPDFSWDINSNNPDYVNSITATLNSGSSYEYTVSLDLQENFSGYERAFTIGAFHSSADSSSSPTTQGSIADAISVIQEAAIPYIDIGTYSTTLGSGLLFAGSPNTLANAYNSNFYNWQIVIASDAQTLTIPTTFNGQTPNVASLVTSNSSGSISSSYVNSGVLPFVNSSGNIELTFTQNTTGDFRVLIFNLAHGSVPNAFQRIQVIQSA